MRYLFMCRSLTYAQRAARLLERSGLGGAVVRVPRTVSSRGCAYGVLVAPQHRDRAAALLASGNLAPERIYIRHADGTLEETDDDLA